MSETDDTEDIYIINRRAEPPEIVVTSNRSFGELVRKIRTTWTIEENNYLLLWGMTFWTLDTLSQKRGLIQEHMGGYNVDVMHIVPKAIVINIFYEG